MPVNINAKLNIVVNQQSVIPAITSIQNAFKGKKIPLEVELKIPKEIDREIYKANRAFEVLDKRLILLKIHATEALFGIQSFITSISGVGKSLNQTLTPSVKSLDQVAKSTTSVTKTIDQAEKSIGGLAESIGASTKRFVSFAIAAGTIANVVFQLQKGFSAALQFDRELVRFKQIGGDSIHIIKDISDEVSNLSKDLGVSSNDLIKSAITLRQAGLSAKETKIALNSLAKTSLAPTFDSIGNTTEAVIATLAQFKKGAGELEKQLGSINRVSAYYAAESSDLTEVIRRTGGAFVAAGGNLEELLALFTSVRATTRESAESIATSFRTIFARLQRQDTIKNLRDVGVELQDLQGRFVGPFEAVKRLNQAFGELPQGSSKFSKIVEEIGGIRQLSKTIPLIQQFPLAMKVYNTALEGQTSLSKDAAIAQEAFLNKIQKLKESMLDLFRIIISNDVFGSLLNFLISTAKAATDLVTAFKPLIPLLTMISIFKFGNFLRTSGSDFRSGFKKMRYDSGGIVPYTPNSGIRIGTDTVPAVLTEGEYVIRRSAAQKIGYDTLDQLNAYADGGVVSVSNRKKAAMLLMNRRSQDSSNNKEEKNEAKDRTDLNVFPTATKATYGLNKKDLSQKLKSAKGYAFGGVIGDKRGSGRGIRTTGGGIIPFSGRTMRGYANGGKTEKTYNTKSNKDSDFPKGLAELMDSVKNTKNRMSPYGTGLNSNFAPIPLTNDVDRIRLSYLEAKQSGLAAARKHFGGGLQGMSGTIELGSVAKDVESNVNTLVNSIKSSFKKVTSAFQSSSKQVVRDSTSFSVEIVDGMRKIVGRIVKDGQEMVFASEKSYLGSKRATKSINKIEELMSSGEYSAEDILSSGKFKKIGSSEKLGRFGRAGKFFKENINTLGVSAALTLPYVSQNVFGDAEKPGFLGTTGAKVGGAATVAIEGGIFGSQLGKAFGPVGMVVGGIVAALGSAILSIKQFDEELKRINEAKISKLFSELDIDPNTGLANNKTALNDLKSRLKDSDLGLLLDPASKDRLSAGPIKNIISANAETGLAEYSGVDQDFEDFKSKYDSAVKTSQGYTEDLVTIIKNAIIKNPNQDINEIGDNLYKNKKSADILKSINPERLKELEEFKKSEERRISIINKVNAIQETAFLSLKDLNTAMEIFGTTIEQAGDKFQKNAAFNAVGSEALTGKVSAGSIAPNIGLFNQFGQDIEKFAKPGGQLDESRKYISEAIKFGLASQKGLNPESVSPDQLDQSAKESGELFLKRFGNNNGFSKSIASSIENVLTSSFGDTAKVPGGEAELLSKLTEDVVGRFKNVQGFRNANNNQLTSAFGNYNQQVSSLAERRGVVLQKVAETSNRGEDFKLTNLQTKEAASGSLTRFVPGGAISSQEILAKEEISTRQNQLKNQLAALGIDSSDSKFRQALGQGELPTGNELKTRLQQAQSQLGVAKTQQKNAANINEYQTATNKMVELTSTIVNLKKGMDLLANSTSVLDAKNKALNIALDQQTQDLEARRSDAEILTFGTMEEKQRLAYKEQLTQTALQNPNALQFATDEEKQLVRERLKENNMDRSFQQYDKFGRERGIGHMSSKQQLEALTNPIYQQLLRAPGAQHNRNRVGRAMAGVEAEQNLLNENARINNNVEINDVKEQRKLMDKNFNEYIKSIDDNLAKSADLFKDFSDAANNLAVSLKDNPIPNEIIVSIRTDNNLSVMGIDKMTNGIKKEVQNISAQQIIGYMRDVVTKDMVA